MPADRARLASVARGARGARRAHEGRTGCAGTCGWRGGRQILTTGGPRSPPAHVRQPASAPGARFVPLSPPSSPHLPQNFYITPNSNHKLKSTTYLVSVFFFVYIMNSITCISIFTFRISHAVNHKLK